MHGAGIIYSELALLFINAALIKQLIKSMDIVHSCATYQSRLNGQYLVPPQERTKSLPQRHHEVKYGMG